MNPEQLDDVVESWRELGIGFVGAPLPARGAPVDLERLIIRTAAGAADMARLFGMTAAWFHVYGDVVAKHRLRRLIRDELAPEFHPVLGLLLDTAQQGQHPQEFRTVIAEMRPAKVARPLFAVERRSVALSARVQRMASPVSRRWRLWRVDAPLKLKALHASQWLMERHPDFVVRADMRGDLRVSVLASLRFDEGAGQSELALARAAGGSRAQVRNALDNLEMTGRIRRLSAGARAGAGDRPVKPSAGARNHNGTRIELLRFG
ncbi:MAG: hypothetical protein EBU31_07215 [Proteobacteria bacterium]|jgi:hypothetical protein|nr:hypothetical protein [Pseudomonadota bacterium]